MKLPWSYSQLNKWEQCAFAAHCAYDLSLRQEKGAGALRGIGMHEDIELYLKTPTQKVAPAAAGPFAEMLSDYRAAGVKSEVKWRINDKWQGIPANVPRGAPSHWATAVIDGHLLAGDTLRLSDWKSGQVYPSHKGQGLVYGAIGFTVHPNIKKALIDFWYLDLEHIGEFEVLKREVPAIRKDFSRRVALMLADETFKPTPSDFNCKYCGFKKSKGGPCPY